MTVELGSEAQVDAPFSWSEKRRLGVEITAAYLRVRWLLWRTRSDLPRTVEVLRAAARLPDHDLVEADADRVGIRLGRAVARALSRLPFDSRCLMRSLVLVSLLARRGVRSTLVVAVRPGPTFESHAWVERGSVPLLHRGHPDFRRILEL
jgi:hypothetical protein